MRSLWVPPCTACAWGPSLLKAHQVTAPPPPSSSSTTQEVYLHPRSALHKLAPEYVVYTQLVRTTKRPYMAGVTAVEPLWLAQSSSPLCKVSEPLEVSSGLGLPCGCWLVVSQVLAGAAASAGGYGVGLHSHADVTRWQATTADAACQAMRLRRRVLAF